jgi:hypothetical protein
MRAWLTVTGPHGVKAVPCLCYHDYVPHSVATITGKLAPEAPRGPAARAVTQLAAQCSARPSPARAEAVD